MFNYSRVKSGIMSIMSLVIIAVIVIYLGINAYLYIFQRDILYLPQKNMANPEVYGLKNAKFVELTTFDNVKIYAWYVAPRTNEPVMVYFHGNAGNLADRSEKLKKFLNHGMGMLAISFRGYGPSEGTPTEEGLYNDGRAAINYLLDNKINEHDIFVYGESLGSGVAVQMAYEYKNLRSVVLEAPYTSIANRAQELYPYIPVKLLLKDQFNSLKKIKKVHVPLLIFHGYRDEVMPINHGRILLMEANQPKQARLFENIGHTDFDPDEISTYTADFISSF